MARFAWNDLRARTAAVLYDIASDYPRGIADYFSEEFRRLGGRVLLEPYTTGARDFRAPLGRVKAARADVLFLPNYPADLRIQFEQARQLGGVGLILGTDTMGFRRQEDLERIERAYFSNHFSPDIPTRRVRSFVAAYQAAFNRVPTASAGPLTYDAFQLLFEAVVRCGSVDPANIGQSLRGTGRFEGVTGVMRFEGSPDPRKSVVIVRVQDGKASFHARVDP
jgi:branched-chain amino acid transport system substrate-binding protein